MSRPTLEQVRRLNDYQRDYKWLLRFLRVPGGGATPEDLNFRCLTISTPKITVDPIEVVIRGHSTNPPGVLKYDKTLTIQFAETISPKIRAFMGNWREKVWQTNTGIQLPYDEITADIELISLDGTEQQQTWTIKIFGAWLQDTDFGSGFNDGAGSDIMRPTATFTYDYFQDNSTNGGILGSIFSQLPFNPLSIF